MSTNDEGELWTANILLFLIWDNDRNNILIWTEGRRGRDVGRDTSHEILQSSSQQLPKMMNEAGF